MKYGSIALMVCALFTFSTSSMAQRTVGGEKFQLDNGAGTMVTIQLPGGLGVGPYTWTLPITASGSAIFPSGTTNNSILRWDAASGTWQEDINALASSAGDFQAASLSAISTATTPALSSSNSGAVSSAVTGATISNLATSSTNSIDKVGVSISATGAWSGTSARVAGMEFNVSGGTTGFMYDLIGTGNLWRVTNGGDAYFNSLLVQGGSVDLNNIGNPAMNIGNGFYNGNIGIGEGTSSGPSGANVTIGNTIGTTSITGNAWSIASNGSAAVTSLTGNVHTDNALPAYNVTSTDMIIIENTNGQTIYLPSSPSAGRILMIRNTGTTSIGINGNGHNINGSSSTYTMNQSGSGTFANPVGATFVYDGSGWWVVGEGD